MNEIGKMKVYKTVILTDRNKAEDRLTEIVLASTVNSAEVFLHGKYPDGEICSIDTIDVTVVQDPGRQDHILKETHMKLIMRKLCEDQKAANFKGFVCPRCGFSLASGSDAGRNAFSLHADVYICEQCGTSEALLDWRGAAVALSKWFHFRKEETEHEKEIYERMRYEHLLAEAYDRLEEADFDPDNECNGDWDRFILDKYGKSLTDEEMFGEESLGQIVKKYLSMQSSMVAETDTWELAIREYLLELSQATKEKRESDMPD